MSSATGGEPGSAAPSPRRRLIFGPEPWREPVRNTWSHWDLWFCMVVVTGFDGDWADLGDEIVRRSPRYLAGRDWEAKLSHLEDLRTRLAAADLDAAALAGEAAHDKKLLAKARRKVLGQPLQGGRDLSPAMRATPRQRLWCRAMHGHWDRFPISPAAAHEQFAETATRQRARGRGAWSIVEALQRRLDDQDRRARDDAARRLALWRGLLTAGIEALGQVRDSDGELAGFLSESLATYARLPWQPSGIEAQVYFTDLCELCVWENHGLLYQRETAPFASVASSTTTWSRRCCGRLWPSRALPGAYRPAATPPPPAKARLGARLHALEPDPATAPVVERIYRMFLDGHGYLAIAERLTADHLPPPSGHDRVRNPTGSA